MCVGSGSPARAPTRGRVRLFMLRGRLGRGDRADGAAGGGSPGRGAAAGRGSGAAGRLRGRSAAECLRGQAGGVRCRVGAPGGAGCRERLTAGRRRHLAAFPLLFCGPPPAFLRPASAAFPRRRLGRLAPAAGQRCSSAGGGVGCCVPPVRAVCSLRGGWTRRGRQM